MDSPPASVASASSCSSSGAPVVLPPLSISGPRGRRVTLVVDPSAGVATVGDLADAVGIGRRSTVLVDGRVVDRSLPVTRAGVIQGSRVTAFDGARALGPAAARGCGAHDDNPAADNEAADNADSDSESADPERSSVVVTVEAGPDSGQRLALPPGRHVIGRAAGARVRLDDATVELHHAVVDVTADGRISLTQVAGRVPCRWIETDAVVLIGASRLRFAFHGDGRPRAAVLTRRDNDPWRRSIHRSPRSLPTWNPNAVIAPAATHSPAGVPGGVLAALLSVLGGVVIALVMRNPLFLLFSAVGLLVALGTRLSGRLARRKEERRHRVTSRQERERFVADIAAQRSERAAYHRAVSPLANEAVAAAVGAQGALWERRADHDDAFGVTLGWGTVRWTPVIDGAAESADLAAIVDGAARFADAPVRLDLGPGAAVALVGDQADGVARSLVVQLAAHTGPADWRLIVLSDRPDSWGWTSWLPHAVHPQPSGRSGLVDPTDVTAVDAALRRIDDGDTRHVVVVTDRADLLANRTGALRRYLGSAASVAVLTVVRHDVAVPSMCRSVLDIGSRCVGRWCPDTSDATATDAVHAAGLTLSTAEHVARRLASVHDPEDPTEASGAVPSSIGLGALTRAVDGVAIDDPIALAAAWRPGDGVPRHGRTGHPTALIGATADGVVEVDLVRDGPHALVAGTTGSGKSELLRTLVVSMAARSSPEELTFVLVDYKGGSTFDACADLPHTVGLVTDLDEHLAARALSSLEAEIRRRERLLRAVAADDLDAYRTLRDAAAGRAHPGYSDGASPPSLPRLVVVIDEFAALKTELPGFVSALVGVAQRGRSLGIHLVLATQRPAGIVSDDIRANTNLRIALRLNDRSDANDIVGDSTPASFPRGTPGRAMMRLGPAETIVFQAATSLSPYRAASGAAIAVVGTTAQQAVAEAVEDAAPSELTVLTRTIRQAASLCEISPPFRPWLEALPESVSPGAIAALLGVDQPDGTTPRVVGVIDDPAAQRRLALRWEPAGGNLALIGSFGSGTTTALRTVLAAARADHHVYVLDARGDGRLEELAGLPGCGGVVGRYDAERRARVLRLVGGEVARRQSDAAASTAVPPIVLAIDGLPGLLDAVSAPGDADEHATLVRILNDGVAVGVHCVATLERGGAVSMSVLAAFGQRWLFHLDDPADGAAVGVRPPHVPPAIPGRIVVTSSKLEAQLAVLPIPSAAPDRSDWDLASAAPEPIATLPDDVAVADLPHSAASPSGSTSLVTGLEFATMRPTAMEIPDGEHALVVGPARSGRSTALVTLASAWRDAHRDGRVIVHSPRPTSPLVTWALATGGAVEIVDAATLSARVAATTGVERIALVVDDAERVDDAEHDLLDLVSARHPLVVVMAAARPDALRSMYGHWTSIVRRSRIGIVMAGGADTDAELLGEHMPRRLPIPARRGLGWLVDGTGRRLVQVARHGPGGTGSHVGPPGAGDGQVRANGCTDPARTSEAGTPNQDSASVA